MYIIAVGVSRRPCANKVFWRHRALFNLHRSDNKISDISYTDKSNHPYYKPTNQRATDRGWQH
jgi:hypothetical protein